MGALDYKTRRHRRTRMAAEMYATWTPRRLFTFGTSVGGAHWFTDPNSLYRRRNLFTETEFRNGTADAPTRSGSISATTLTGYAGALAFGWDGVTSAAAYKTNVTTVVGSVYFISAVVKMDDGNAPAFGSATPSAASNDFAFTLANAQVAPNSYVVTDLGGGVYRVSATATAALASINNGIIKYTTNSSRTFKATAYQIEQASALSAYQPVSTWPEAYLAAVGAENIFDWVDSAGATPVTAVGDTIGLSLDRAYGGRTDGSLIASGATGLTGTATAASYNTSTGAGSVSRAGDASNQSWASWTGLTTSSIHRIRITNTGATSLDVRNGSVSGTIVASIAAGATSYVHPLTSGGSTSITITATNNSTTATFTVLEFGRVPGTHLIQATGTARPTLSARVNWLTATELLDTWTKTGTAPTVTDGYVIGGGDNVPCSRLVFTASGSSNRISKIASGYPTSSGVTVPGKVFVRMRGAVGGEQLRIWNGWPSVDQTVSLTTSWQEFTISDAGGNSSSGLYLYAVSGTPTIYVRGVDIRTADDAAKNIPVYQRVGATAADHDTDGFPHYALFDGTDDSWASTATVDGSGSDKATVVAGVTKNSDAATGIVAELTASVGANNGSFYVAAPNDATNRLSFVSKGTSQRSALTTASAYNAPVTVVQTGVGDIGADRCTLSANGVQIASATNDQGTGNYSNATLYVGSRAGTSLRLNGRIYSLVFRFGAMSDTDRNRLEQWTKNLMRLP